MKEKDVGHVVYSYRYMWTVKSVPDKVQCKIVTDVDEGFSLFEKNLLTSVPDILNLGREYLCEYDFTKVGVFESLKSEVKEDEKV